MKIDGWKYYNHAAIPTTAPHEIPDISPIIGGSIWKIGGGTPLLARWTTEFDCGYETNWWYVIKDEPFDLAKLKAKRRYEINKGNKNFDIRLIDPQKYREELYKIQIAAFSTYPSKYRPMIDKDTFFQGIEGWSKYRVFGAFFKADGELVGYSLLKEENEKFVDFSVQKTTPSFEKNAINAALVDGILNYYSEFLKTGGYICDGSRSINHETAFQDYLVKYFGFRKAYCELHIMYNPKVKWIIKMIYPFRRFLAKINAIGIIHQLNAVLRMEEIVRKNNE